MYMNIPYVHKILVHGARACLEKAKQNGNKKPAQSRNEKNRKIERRKWNCGEDVIIDYAYNEGSRWIYMTVLVNSVLALKYLGDPSQRASYFEFQQYTELIAL